MKKNLLQRFWLVPLAGSILLFTGQISRADQVPLTPSEYQVKAAFLYNFAKFVEWPPETVAVSTGTFTLCIIGQDPFGQDLDDEIAGKIIQDKTLVIKRLDFSQSAAGCQVVFISASESRRLGEILNTLEKTPALTVSDMRRFTMDGGMVGFSIENGKVRFSVNLTAAEGARLKISSQLLKLAKAVQGKPVLKSD